MLVSYVCGFNLMKSEYHEISIVEVPLVKIERSKQEKHTEEEEKLLGAFAWV